MTDTRTRATDTRADRQPDLGLIVADAREDVAVLRRMGSPHAQYVGDLLDKISEAAEDFLTWLSEDKAKMKSGWSYRTLRRRFPELLACGLARYGQHGQREYRSLAIPPRNEVVEMQGAA